MSIVHSNCGNIFQNISVKLLAKSVAGFGLNAPFIGFFFVFFCFDFLLHLKEETNILQSRTSSSNYLCHGHPIALAVIYPRIACVVQVSGPLPNTVTGHTRSSKLSFDFAQSELVMVGIPSPCVCNETELKATNWPEPISGTGHKDISSPNISLTGCKLISIVVQIVCRAGLRGITVIVVLKLQLYVVVGAIVVATASHCGDTDHLWTWRNCRSTIALEVGVFLGMTHISTVYCGVHWVCISAGPVSDLVCQMLLVWVVAIFLAPPVTPPRVGAELSTRVTVACFCR